MHRTWLRLDLQFINFDRYRQHYMVLFSESNARPEKDDASREIHILLREHSWKLASWPDGSPMGLPLL